MNKIYLNELSLDGQFRDLNEFLDQIMPLIRCLKFIHEKNWKIYKHSTFYDQKITEDKKLFQLKEVRDDRLTRIKSLLLGTTEKPPFWDVDSMIKQDLNSKYLYDVIDVSATSIAEAAEEKGVILSFSKREYNDTIMKVVKDKIEEFSVPSITTLEYLIEKLWELKIITLSEYLLIKYKGTRLDFSLLEKEYSLEDFEKHEVEDCINSFDKFVSLESWDMIFQDNGLCYKQYSPSNKKNWFKGSQYEEKQIYKFRCGNPKRCFGYRENDIFYVLRMERDHKISDYG